ncbi:hypothetical protein D3C81_2110130 [compost metagenome]
MLEPEPADGGNEHDAHARPDRIDDAGRNDLQGQGQTPEGDAVANHGDDAGPQAAETLGGLQGAGGDHFGDDGDGQVEIGHGETHAGLLIVG